MNPFPQPVDMAPAGPAHQVTLLDGAQEQFRLSRIQTYHWGTFSNVHDFVIPKEGYLFVGPSGSGKSTVLDGHAALLTPPKWVGFNAAARENERGNQDRNLVSYVRGAWATQTGTGGELAVQYLRTGSTWSAIIETYRNDNGRVVTLALILWLRGASTALGDVQRRYLTLERELSIQELDFFPQNDFDVRRFKLDLPDATLHPEFAPFGERFRRLLGIENERALRLLHKTQSAKNLGDLNTFLRDFMLDEPQTFEAANQLVAQFDELNEAHQSVVAAREQVDMLIPAQLDYEELQGLQRTANELKEVSAGLDHYKERVRRELLDAAITEETVALEGSRQKALLRAQEADSEYAKLDELRQRRLGMGGSALETLQRDLKAAEEERPLRQNKRDSARAACEALGWALPDEVVWFVRIAESARDLVNNSQILRDELEAQKDEAKAERVKVGEEMRSVHIEVEAMKRQPSNLPSPLLDLRDAIAAEIGVASTDLPFAGELLEVRQDSREWQGAIERVLGGFARSLLVDDRYSSAVAAYVNGRNIGQHLVYHRVRNYQSGNTLGEKSLVHKLRIADHAHTGWLREELKTHFDYLCADTLAEFKAVPRGRRAVTKEGLIKHSDTRHEKNDRFDVNDRRKWLLGFDNTAKRLLFEERGRELAERYETLNATVSELSQQEKAHGTKVVHAVTLANLTWTEVDVASLVLRIKDLEGRIEQEKRDHPDLGLLDLDIKRQEGVHRSATEKKNQQEVESSRLQSEITKLEGRKLESLRRHELVAETPTQLAALDARFARYKGSLTWENIGDTAGAVLRALNAEASALTEQMNELRNAIVRRFAEFNHKWSAESDGLDASMASADDYFGKLTRLQNDRLPQFEERFFTLLREQSGRNLMTLRTLLSQERSAIRSKMDQVNENLRHASYNPGTHLVIQPMDRSLPDVQEFLATLKEALSHTLMEDDRDQAEQRFRVLATLVRRLASQETADRNWRALVLDVRLHVEFKAQEVDEAGVEIEAFQSGAGKSGGQRQKLTATCLGAALRYQLSGNDQGLPSFSTVVLDEAFDKADQDFTRAAMNIFKNFGFQMIVATPMKGVMTLEPFIGGACFVHIKDRKRSQALFVDYNHETRRLKLEEGMADAQEASAT